MFRWIGLAINELKMRKLFGKKGLFVLMSSNPITYVIGQSDVVSFLIAKKHVYKPEVFRYFHMACTELAEVETVAKRSLFFNIQLIIAY